PTLSIAGIDSKVSRPRHTGDVASLTAALKKKLKRMPGSHYMFWAPDADAPAVAE
ncbi:MAG: hypothetical protein HY042_13320, partial [Spirochaetia bacterium]|nr:hypothetical protein [Spirochaetia bacterium]